MKFAHVFALALGSLSFAAHAEEMTKAELYTALCQPGSPSESTWTSAQRKEALEFRSRFQEFLRNPAPVVRMLEAKADSKKLDLSDQLSLIFGYAFTCGAIETLRPEIMENGCFVAKDKRISVAKADRTCSSLIEKMKARNANHGSENDTEESSEDQPSDNQ